MTEPSEQAGLLEPYTKILEWARIDDPSSYNMLLYWIIANHDTYIFTIRCGEREDNNDYLSDQVLDIRNPKRRHSSINIGSYIISAEALVDLLYKTKVYYGIAFRIIAHN